MPDLLSQRSIRGVDPKDLAALVEFEPPVPARKVVDLRQDVGRDVVLCVLVQRRDDLVCG